ncbi:unnamed protein product [Arctogadus glacialis]
MLRYLLKTLLQMNLFTDSLRDHNETDPFLNGSIPPYNGSMLDWGNFTGFNVCVHYQCDGMPLLFFATESCDTQAGRRASLRLGFIFSETASLELTECLD